MRKYSILPIIFIAALSFVLFFNAGEKQKEEIQWKFLNAIPYAEDWYRQVLDPYMDEHPGQTYEMTTIRWDLFFEKFTTSAASGAEMDVIFLDSSLIRPMYKAGSLLDLTDIVGDTSVFRLEHPAGVYVWDDRIWALPLNGLDSSGVFYNIDIFEKYGLEVPETYDELVAVSKVLRQNGIGPLLANGDTWAWTFFTGNMFSQLIPDWDKYMVELGERKHKFTDPEGIEGFRWLKRLRDDGVFVDDITGIDENTGYSMFITGKAAMFFNGTWIVPILADTAGGADNLPRIGVMHFPFLTSERVIAAQGGFVFGIGLYSGIPEEKKEAALDIIRYMTSPEVCKILAELDGAVLATRKDVEIEMGELTAQFSPMAPNTYAAHEWFWPEEVAEANMQNAEAVAAGLISPEEAAQNCQDVFDQVSK